MKYEVKNMGGKTTKRNLKLRDISKTVSKKESRHSPSQKSQIATAEQR